MEKREEEEEDENKAEEKVEKEKDEGVAEEEEKAPSTASIINRLKNTLHLMPTGLHLLHQQSTNSGPPSLPKRPPKPTEEASDT